MKLTLCAKTKDIYNETTIGINISAQINMIDKFPLDDLKNEPDIVMKTDDNKGVTVPPCRW